MTNLQTRSDYQLTARVVGYISNCNDAMGTIRLISPDTQNSPESGFGLLITFATHFSSDETYLWRYQFALINANTYVRRKINKSGSWTSWEQWSDRKLNTRLDGLSSWGASSFPRNKPFNYGMIVGSDKIPEDSYFIGVDSSNGLYVGSALNRSTTITWKKIG